MEKKRHPSDPRNDLVTDHRHWMNVLWNCWHLEQNLYYLLHGIRCGGAEIIRTNSSFRLMPGEWSDAEWEKIRHDKLSAYQDELVYLFKLTKIGKVTDEKPPEEFLRK